MGALISDDDEASALVGRFGWDPREKSAWWSDGMFRLYGFDPGAVVPTPELAVTHKHPDDRARYEALLATIASTPGDFALWHRIVDAHGDIRRVVTTGTAYGDDTGGVTRVEGYTVDVSSPHRTDADEGVKSSVARFRESAAVIEQAKGVLMAALGVDADEAFDILRSTSIDGNVKLRTLAGVVVAHGPGAIADVETGGFTP